MIETNKLSHRTDGVCVCAGSESVCENDERNESQDGAATPPRGRVLRTRQFRTTTTTSYTLRLFCSSSANENNSSVHKYRADGREWRGKYV